MSRAECVRETRSQVLGSVRKKSRHVLFALLAGCVSATVGCSQGESRLPTHKVTGKVVKNGAGVPNATVIFHAKNPPKDFIKPRAISTADGTFVLTTYESGDGAPVGEYEVTLEQWLNDNPQVGATNRLPQKLGSPETSGIKATVAATENALSPFEVR